VVDDGGAAHQPRVGGTSDGVAALLGAEHARLLLGSADEQHPLGPVKGGQVLLGDVVLALAGPEVDQVNAGLGEEAVNGGDEGLRDWVHQGRRHEREAPVDLEEANHPQLVLEARLIDVQEHAVDALNLKGHVVAEDIGHAAR
jgi:hypothetical protein